MFEKHTDPSVFWHLLWNRLFHYRIMYYFLKAKVVPTILIYIHLRGGFNYAVAMVFLAKGSSALAFFKQ